MLSPSEIQDYCRRHNLPAPGNTYVETMVNSDPARAVGNRMGNVCGKFASEKMRCTLQFESHTIELPFLIWAEHNQSVQAIYDQPPQLRLECPKKDGTLGAFFYTPDFGLLTYKGPEFVECKPVAKLRELAMKSPWRYVSGADGKWHCPPAEKVAAELGFRFRVVTEGDLNPVFTINAQLLADDLRADREPVPQATLRSIKEAVSAAPGIAVAALTAEPHSFRMEDVRWTLANRAVFFDWEAVPLTQPERVRVYATVHVAEAYRVVEHGAGSRDLVRPGLIDLRPGTELVWGERVFRILNVEAGTVVLAAGTDSVSVAREILERHVKAGEISGLAVTPNNAVHPDVVRALGEARQEDLAEALRRHRAITGETPRNQTPESDRTICRWEEQSRIAEAKYGYGFVGLLPALRNCGNRRPRFPERILEVMETVYTEQYLTKKAKSAKRAYEQLQLQCERQGLRAPSCKTWLKFIRKHPKHAAALARQGKRVAYQCQSDRPGHHRVDGPAGSWPWKKAHLDHTRIDAEAVDKETAKRIERPWLSIVWDEDTTRILAVYVSFDAPSFRSCMGIFRECVRRHGRLPESIVVDNGPEFRSIYFETVAALFRVTLLRRPPGMPRFGAGCERAFGTINQEFFHVLAGNTKITRNVRQVTKSVNPRALALWSLEEMDEALCAYAYEIYEQREGPSLHMTPAQAYAQGMKLCGERPNRMISYNRDFLILTMPSTRTGRAKVQTGVGIKVNRIWYWNDRMAEPEIEGSHLDVRFDPDDMGHVYAQIKGAWVECQSEYYHVFHGRSDREITFASREVSALNGLHEQKCAVYGKRLAEFLEKVEGQERLMEQRIRDLAQRRVQEKHDRKARGGNELEPALPAEAAAPATLAKSNIVPIPTAHSNAETNEAPLRLFAEF